MKYLLVALAALIVGTAHGYEVNPYRWRTMPVGYTAAPGLAPYADTATAQWAAWGDVTFTVGNQVVLHFDDTLTVAGLASTAFYLSSGTLVHCDIAINSVQWPSWDEGRRQRVVTHEMGHCLGLAHSTVTSVMLYNASSPPTVDDMAGILTLYPKAGRRLVAVGVGRD